VMDLETSLAVVFAFMDDPADIVDPVDGEFYEWSGEPGPRFKIFPGDGTEAPDWDAWKEPELFGGDMLLDYLQTASDDIGPHHEMMVTMEREPGIDEERPVYRVESRAWPVRDAPPYTAGLETNNPVIELRYQSGDPHNRAIRNTLVPLGLSQWLGPIVAVEAVILNAMVRNTLEDIPPIGEFLDIGPPKAYSYKPEAFVTDLYRSDVVAFLHQVAALDDAIRLGHPDHAADPNFVQDQVVRYFRTEVLDRLLNDGLTPNDENRRRLHMRTSDFWDQTLRSLVRKVYENREFSEEPFELIDLHRIRGAHFEQVHPSRRVEIPLRHVAEGHRIQIGSLEVRIHFLRVGDRDQYDLYTGDAPVSTSATLKVSSNAQSGVTELRMRDNLPGFQGFSFGFPRFGASSDIEISVQDRSVLGPQELVLVIDNNQAEIDLLVQRTVPSEAAYSPLDQQVIEAREMMQEVAHSDYRRSGLIKLMQILELASSDSVISFSRWGAISTALGSVPDTIGYADWNRLGPDAEGFVSNLVGLMWNYPPEFHTFAQREEEERRLRAAVAEQIDRYRERHGHSPSIYWARRWFSIRNVHAAWSSAQITAPQPSPGSAVALLRPIFFSNQTFHLLPLVARAGIPAVVIVDSDGEESFLRSALGRLEAPLELVDFRVRRDPQVAVSEIIRGETDYNNYVVDPAQEDWAGLLVNELLSAGAQISRISRALELTQGYLARFL
jgi:hypothetical protein